MAGKGGYGRSAESLDLAGFAEVAGVSRETAERFDVWRGLIERWGRRINLVGPGTLPAFWSRHALDCAQVADFAPETEGREGPLRWVDIGSGAGFPGLAIALVLEGAGRADEVHLVEPNQKKAAFLREAVRATGSRAIVRVRRVEDLGASDGPRARGASLAEEGAGVSRETFDVITARACAPLTRLLGYAHPLWKEQSVGVFLKGREAEVELTAAGKSWRFRSELQPSRSDPDGRVVLIERLEHVPST